MPGHIICLTRTVSPSLPLPLQHHISLCLPALGAYQKFSTLELPSLTPYNFQQSHFSAWLWNCLSGPRTIFSKKTSFFKMQSFCQAGECYIICGGRQHLGGNNFLSSVQVNLSPTLVKLIAANLVEQTQPFRGKGIHNQKILRAFKRGRTLFLFLFSTRLRAFCLPSIPSIHSSGFEQGSRIYSCMFHYAAIACCLYAHTYVCICMCVYLLCVCIDGVHMQCTCSFGYVERKREEKRNSPFELISFHRCPDMKGGSADIC